MKECPVCQAELKGDENACPVCDSEIRVVWEMESLPKTMEELAQKAGQDGDPDRALTYCRIGLETEPDNENLLRLSARMHKSLGHEQEEAAAWQALLSFHPQDQEALRGLEAEPVEKSSRAWNWKYVFLVLAALAAGWFGHESFYRYFTPATASAPVQVVENKPDKKELNVPLPISDLNNISRLPDKWSEKIGRPITDVSPGAEKPGSEAVIAQKQVQTGTEASRIQAPAVGEEDEKDVVMAVLIPYTGSAVIADLGALKKEPAGPSKEMVALAERLSAKAPKGLEITAQPGGISVSGMVHYPWDKQKLERDSREWNCELVDLTRVTVRRPDAFVYKIKKGDTLHSIAGRFLNKSGAWKVLHELNKKAVPNPSRLDVGQEIIICRE